MKPFIAASCCLLLTFAPILAVAENGDTSPEILAVNRSVSISYLMTHLYYIEPSDTDVFTFKNSENYLDYETGNTNGARLRASWMQPAKKWFLQGRLDMTDSIIDYIGHVGKTPFTGLSRATFKTWDFKAGRGVPFRRDWLVTPYLEFGLRDWSRELGADGVSGEFNEDYRNASLALGGMVQHKLSGPWVWTADAAIGRTVNPNISTSDGALASAPLDSNSLVMFGMEADYHWEEAVHLFLGFDYLTFSYGQTPISNATIEPISFTSMYNYTLGLRWSY